MKSVIINIMVGTGFTFFLGALIYVLTGKFSLFNREYALGLSLGLNLILGLFLLGSVVNNAISFLFSEAPLEQIYKKTAEDTSYNKRSKI